VRVLHLIQRYYPARGGAEKYLEDISNHLAQVGHQVTVATSDALDFELFWDPGRKRISDLTDSHAGVEIIRFPVRHLPVSRLAFPGLRRLLLILSRIAFVPAEMLYGIANFTPWLPSLWRWTRDTESSFDIVAGSSIGFEPFVAAAQAYANRINAPFVCIPLTHLGAGPSPGADAVSQYYTMRHQSNIVLASDMVVAMTPAEQSYYENQGLIGEKSSIVGPGINPSEVLGGNGERFRKKREIEKPLILYIGYLSRDKGAFDTVEALLQLGRQGIEAELALIGAISSEFQEYFDELPEIEKKIIHPLGTVEDSEKRDALSAASLLSMPSRTDSFGITYLEAWTYGVPVIAARTWGVTDVVEDGNDGIVIPFGDVSSLSEAMRSLVDHPERAIKMGERGRAKVYQKHLTDTKVRAIEKIYQDLIADRKLARVGSE